MADIIDKYRPEIWRSAGDTSADRKNMLDGFQNGLLHLVYYLLYTEAGREYMHEWVPGEKGKTEEAVRVELKRKFREEFAVDDGAQEAMIGAHLAGFAWIAAYKANNIAERDKQQAIYKQNLAAVSWFLWEQGSGDLFPLGW